MVWGRRSGCKVRYGGGRVGGAISKVYGEEEV